MRTGTQGLPDEADTLHEHDADTSLMLETSEPQWPEITNLCTVPGTTRVTLSIQTPLIRLVIQDAFEHVRASLLFKHAYPNPIVVIGVVKGALLSAAESHRPSASSIHNRLLHDDPYMFKMSCLVSILPYLDSTYLMPFAAARPDPSFPKRGERTLWHVGGIKLRGYQGTSNCSSGRKSTQGVQLHVSKRTQCTCNVS
jgi:hypothetical protein